jgi:hypothetical protein
VGRTIRFSIAGLMGVVLIVAIGLAALRSGSEIWAGVIFLTTCGVLALSIVGIFCRRDAERAWWLGFALFGWGYMALAFWPWGTSGVHRLPTSAFLEWLDVKLNPSTRGASIGPAAGGMGSTINSSGVQGGMYSVLVATTAGGFGGAGGGGAGQPFEQVGHCLWALLFAIVGGTLASILFSTPQRRSEERQNESGSTDPQTWEGWLRPALIGGVGIGLIVLIALIRPNAAPGLAAGSIYLVTCGLLALAMLGAALSHGRPRQIWLGAAFFGTGYMILAFGRAATPHPQPYFPTDEFLAVLRSWLPPATAGSFISSEPKAANARILQALDQPISMSFANETPLEDILKYIQQATQGPDGKQIAIYVDPVGLQEAEKSMTSTVTIDMEGVPLRSTLRECLTQLGLEYYVGDGFLKISSRSRVWPVFDDPFRIGGHCILALIAAAVGGVLAPLVAAARSRRSSTSG